MRISILFITILTACGTSTPAKSPEPIHDVYIQETSPQETVGIVFEDRNNSERKDRTPPPTTSYKIQGKVAKLK